MRKKEREITEFSEKMELLERCNTIRLGLRGKEFPYVVPLSFGYETQGETVRLYFHGAKEGLKHELIALDPHVCIEADIFHNYARTTHSVTTEYESLIGFGLIREVHADEAAHGLDLLLQHCGYPEFSGADCIARGITKVYCVTLQELTGKRRSVKVE